MKVQFDAYVLVENNAVHHTLVDFRYGINSDIGEDMTKVDGKWCRVTIETIKEPVLESPKVCYMGMPV